jgi:hypothetical protein
MGRMTAEEMRKRLQSKLNEKISQAENTLANIQEEANTLTIQKKTHRSYR